MRLSKFTLGAVSALALSGSMVVADVAAAQEILVPSLVYRTGPYAPNGVPFANGIADYFALLNARDGGIGGVKIKVEECETGYKTTVGVECYEALKAKGAVSFSPLSTGITYQLIPKASEDKIPIFSMGYGRTSAADGRVFKWIFNFPTTYWSQASAVVKYFGSLGGGMDSLKGKKIVHIYHNSAYGKEANPTLEILAKKYGYDLTLLAVDHPGQEQKSTWLQVRRIKPDYIFMSGWGVMNQVAIKEAAAINFPMKNFLGNWWSGTESDTIPAGAGADGYTSTNFHSVGADFSAHADIKKYLYSAGKGAGDEKRVGEVLYNRGMVNAVFIAEAISVAQKKFGVKQVTGEQVRYGYENLNMDAARWKELGLDGFMGDVKVTCKDHEGGGGVVFIQKWNAGSKTWSRVGGKGFTPMRDVVRPLIEADAAAFAKENGITPRDCS